MAHAADLTFVTYEDRESDCVGLKLLALSIFQGGSNHQLICFCPRSFTAFRQWAFRYPALEVRDSDLLGVYGWEVKPTLLLKLLDEGIAKPIWIDSDIILTRPVDAHLFDIAEQQLLTTEENSSHGSIDADRTAMTGLVTARRFKIALNSGVVRVSEAHRALLGSWAHRMSLSDFQEARRDTTKPRPTHLASDQDVLEALLGSAEFSHVPVRQLTAGIEIAQCWSVFGYSFRHRLRALFFGVPPIVHALGTKPWRVVGNSLARVSADLHPYNRVAARFGKQIEENASWLEPRTLPGRVFLVAGCGSVVLPGMLLQILVGAYQLMLPIVRLVRRR